MSDYTFRSWLFTTDHQRIGKLYLGATTIFLALGTALGVVMRLELLTPAGDLAGATTYEDLFTAHGLMMVHLFLLPLFPAVLGNLRGMTTAFPFLNPVAWWLYVAGAVSFTMPLVDASVFLTSLNLVITLHRRRAWRGTVFERGMYAGGLALLIALPLQLPLYALLMPAVGILLTRDVPRSAAALLLALGSLSAVILPGWLASDTYFAVGQFHLLSGAVLLAYWAGLGSRAPLNWIAAGFLITFLPYFILGYFGLPARYHDYPPEFQPWQIVSTMGALALAVALLLRGSRE